MEDNVRGTKDLKQVKLLKYVVLAVVIFCLSTRIPVKGSEKTGNCGTGASWSLNDNGILKITGTGKVDSNPWGAFKESVKEAYISEGITGIGGGLFQDHSSLLKVYLPASLNEIGEDPHPFIYSPSLKSISVDTENTSFASEDGVLFTKDMKTLIACPGGKEGSYTIPSSVTRIGPEAFFDCGYLTKINIPSGVQEIGVRAFYRCFSLEKAEVPVGVKRLEKSVFEQCESMTTVELPQGLTYIDTFAFWGDKALTRIVIPDGVTELGREAFSNCDSLAAAFIPDSVKYFNDGTFDFGSKVIIYCSEGSKADMYAKANGLSVSYSGKYEPDGSDGDGDKKDTEQLVKDGIRVGETKEFEDNSTIKGGFLDTAFKADSSNPEVADVTAIARTGNIIYQDAVNYYFSVWVKGIAPGTATITLYDNSKTKVIWTKAVTVIADEKPAIDSVKLSKKKVKVNRKVTITVVTSDNVKKLSMYIDGKKAKNWTKGYTDKDGKRTWKVTYTFKNTGKQKLTFKAFDQDGKGSAKKKASITITKS